MVSGLFALRVSEAIEQMVIDKSGSLKVGVDNSRSKEFKSLLFEIFTQGVRKGRGRRNLG